MWTRGKVRVVRECGEAVSGEAVPGASEAIHGAAVRVLDARPGRPWLGVRMRAMQRLASALPHPFTLPSNNPWM